MGADSEASEAGGRNHEEADEDEDEEEEEDEVEERLENVALDAAAYSAKHGASTACA